MKKLFYITGLESSGSALAASIVGHVLGIVEFEHGKCLGGKYLVEKDDIVVVHRSLPYYRNPRKWLNLNEIQSEYRDYDRHFILTLRDRTISEKSRIRRFPDTNVLSAATDTDRAIGIIKQIMHSGEKYMLWSYEMFMLLKLDYLRSLYDFIGCKSTFVPDLIDANKNYLGGS